LLNVARSWDLGAENPVAAATLFLETNGLPWAEISNAINQHLIPATYG
jgi:hypothetical protein